jgi:hypothetical protein
MSQLTPPASRVQEKAMTGIERIAAERQRQIEKEGWTPEHAATHINGELAMAAACYAAPDLIYAKNDHANGFTLSDPWPWESKWDKRLSPRSNVIRAPWNLDASERIDLLVKAGALIAAEIDRLQR